MIDHTLHWRRFGLVCIRDIKPRGSSEGCDSFPCLLTVATTVNWIKQGHLSIFPPLGRDLLGRIHGGVLCSHHCFYAFN